MSLFDAFLRRLVRVGRLTVVGADGTAHHFGPGGTPAVRVRLYDERTRRRLLLNPELCLGEAYMDGSLVIEEGSLDDLLVLCTSNAAALERHPLGVLQRLVGRVARFVQQYNPLRRARDNVAHHYDLSGRLYELFLDRDLQYSCAYFCNGDESLEEAQQRKQLHIASKLLLEPGMRVLDIGSGWGGLELYLAQAAKVDVTGLTLSQEQLEVTRRRIDDAGLAQRARVALRDYREETGSYDRIVSVGMFEHVGVAHYRRFFTKLRELLKPRGVALLHAIGRMNVPGTTNAWIRKYIFPGGYCPALSEVLAAIERSGLWVTDIEILRLHYADTLREWSRRFRQHRAEIARLYDERFCRMWEFYLAVSESAFRNEDHMVFQIQLARRQDAVPLTRDYIATAERRALSRSTRRVGGSLRREA
jgi:cyclopropane-fatty-acyl-phospholipid synthase